MNMDELNPDTARIIYNGENELGSINVYENNKYRWLSFANKQTHSAMLLEQTWKPVLPYYPVLLSSLLFNSKPESVLLIGLGGGDLVRFYRHHLPTAKLHVVEVSDVVIDLYKQHFSMSTNGSDEPLILQMDVCAYLKTAKPSVYDTVYLDVYGEDSLPDCFYQPDFYRRLCRMISTSGVVAVNFVIKDEEDALRLMRLMYEGFEQQILCLSVGRYMNLVVLGFRQDPLLMTEDDLHNSLYEIANRFEMDVEELITNLVSNNPHRSLQLQDRFRV